MPLRELSQRPGHVQHLLVDLFFAFYFADSPCGRMDNILRTIAEMFINPSPCTPKTEVTVRRRTLLF